jgi:cysteinyl-tRNA synthetase
MGHARTYVSLDIIRRITKEYLNYNVILCQNVTDVDDKIIIRSSEQKIHFTELAKKYEKEFVEDMAALGVPLPDVVTRVSEFIPEIVAYVQKLVDSGIAYEANGSVYFSTEEFEKQGHKYGKLMPETIGNSDLLDEGEGALSAGDEKRTATDFVLWKKTKEHTQESGVVEPSWPSPWGPGRPGWHIECSAMSHFATEKLGSTNSATGKGTLDVHAGGVDLKFPHHENEIAQSEGYSGSHQWVNYWLHTGHLNIKGFKMSKSLKNFITIRQALEKHSARQIRFCFLLHKYNSPMDYGDNTMTESVNIERIFSEYFHNVKAVLRRLGSDGGQYVGPREKDMLNALTAAKAGVYSAVMDDFDTPQAVTVLVGLVRDCNRYMEGGSAPHDQTGADGGAASSSSSSNAISSVILGSVARYITTTFKTFGLVPSSVDIGFGMSNGNGLSSGGDGEANSGASKEDLLTPYLDVLTKFRETVRVAAINGDTKAVLTAADDLRDSVLPELGVRMEDKGSGKELTTVWKLDDPEVLRKEKALKEEAKAAKQAAKEEALRRAEEKEARARVPASQLFLSMTDMYSKFDADTGIPTHDKDGEPLSKGAAKKLQKEHAKQVELNEKFAAK